MNEEDTNHPARYGGDTTYECVKVLKAWLSSDEYKGFLQGNAIKYLCRLGKKDKRKTELTKANLKTLSVWTGNIDGVEQTRT